MNLINAGTGPSFANSKPRPTPVSQLESGGKTALQTPVTVAAPVSKVMLITQDSSPVQTSQGPETPLLHCNSVSSTLLGQGGILGSGLPSGISSLSINMTSDNDSSIPSQVKPVNYMPPPLRRKPSRCQPPSF